MKRIAIVGLVLISTLNMNYQAFGHGIQSHSKGNGNHANVNYCQPTIKVEPKVIYKTRWKTKVVYKDRPVVKKKVEKVEVVRHEGRKNALSVIGGVSKTDIRSRKDGNTTVVDTQFEPDVGVMFQHDFGRIRGSVSGTINRNLMLGVGLTF